VVLAGSGLNAPPAASALVGTVACLGLRITAIYRHWTLPDADRRARAR
jgi:uncharacterized membrane protein YeiH